MLQRYFRTNIISTSGNQIKTLILLKIENYTEICGHNIII